MINQPTPEELKAKQEEAIRVIEEMENSDQVPEPEDSEDEVEVEEVETPIEESQNEEVTEDVVTEEEEKVESEPEKKETPKETLVEDKTTEEKLKQSSQEALRLLEDKNKLESAVDDAYLLPEPTEEQLKAEYSDWDDLTESQKKIYATALHNKNITNKIREIKTDQRDKAERVKEFVEKVDLYSIDPDTLKKYPLLEGKQNALKEFANNPKRTNMDMSDLVELFLVKNAEKTVKHTGKMFETGTGGDNKTPQKKNDGVISLAEANLLMKTNYSLYKEKLMQKKIDFSTI